MRDAIRCLRRTSKSVSTAGPMRERLPMSRFIDDNRAAWNAAAQKYVDETAEILEQARQGVTLAAPEVELLRPVLETNPFVVHFQSGFGLDDLDLSRLGARGVVGLDFSSVQATAASERARAMEAPVSYAVAVVPESPLRSGCADLVYTGKGALMWLDDIAAWAIEVARLLKPCGALFVYEAHPATALWARDGERAALAEGVSYFGGTRVNDTFPGQAVERFAPEQGLRATEQQWTLGEIVNAVIAADMTITDLREYPDPFWKPVDSQGSPIWDGNLPNAFSMMATRNPITP